jgi:hypothetical protein
MVRAIRRPEPRTLVRHFGTVSTALTDGGFIIYGADGMPAHIDVAEAARSGVVLRAGDRVEFSIRLGGAAFDVMLAVAYVSPSGEPQVDDRHLLDGIAGAVMWSAAAA